MYRTFFLITAPTLLDVYVKQRVTYEDVVERIVVEQVGARLDNKPITDAQLRAAMPAAHAAAIDFLSMQRRCMMLANTLGPYRLLTEHIPTDDELTHWWLTYQNRGADGRKQNIVSTSRDNVDRVLSLNAPQEPTTLEAPYIKKAAKSKRR